MKRNIIETVLGAVVLLVAGAFLLYSTTASRAGSVQGYKIFAKFNEVGGLKQGDDARIGGVKIGSVDKIDLDPQTYQARVTISVKDDVKIPHDTSARISSESLMGGNYVALDVGGDEETLKAGDTLQYTQDSQNLEQLLGKFIFSMNKDKSDDAKQADATPAPAAAVKTETAPAPNKADPAPKAATTPAPAQTDGAQTNSTAVTPESTTITPQTPVNDTPQDTATPAQTDTSTPTPETAPAVPQ